MRTGYVCAAGCGCCVRGVHDAQTAHPLPADEVRQATARVHGQAKKMCTAVLYTTSTAAASVVGITERYGDDLRLYEMILE